MLESYYYLNISFCHRHAVHLQEINITKMETISKYKY